MPNPAIGHLVCPSCDVPGAEVREARTKKVYVVCEGCGYQAFARDKVSDTNIRRKMKPVAAAPAPAGEDKKGKGIWDLIGLGDD